MDRHYKSLFLQVVKEHMSALLSEFSPVKLIRTQAMADAFSGSLLYNSTSNALQTIWICWQPDLGVERRFFVRLGWSPSPDVLPIHPIHDSRILQLRGPIRDYPACSLPLEQILGQNAIGGFEIPSPWDQVYKLKPTTPAAEQKRIIALAASEAGALSKEQRIAAITVVVGEVFASLLRVLPTFRGPAAHRDA